MSGTSGDGRSAGAQRDSRAPLFSAALLCLVAIAAVLATAPVALRHWRPTVQSLAPGLAALSDQQLADLLPKPADFPTTWTVDTRTGADRFGYFRTQPFRSGDLDYDPPECANINDLAPGIAGGAEIAGRDPADPPERFGQHPDVRLQIGREFNQSGFDAMTARVSRCARFTFADTINHTVHMIEDSRSARGPRLFRISVTTAFAGSTNAARTQYLSFAQLSNLVLVGDATTSNQHVLDVLFESTLRRIGSG
ncbi:hypothetical protein C3477_18185 [Mycobacterium kansasii]|uniref:hypothetical protein n=1 Tax=Mycobacterium kansasii TaxID=1768 RepID=UPI000CDD2B49|nr:hypothetical protein [Mycobacterium kansasii]POX84569.1 hypothetical protein C3B43_22920 [Mycobacterium kansasii]POY02378.1 hypothetical protein C3477_18185 [Mycobacterium kansasii]POY15447.1 hypothetical protein C3476_24795 [Mycobacterium kansasii]